MHFTNLLDYELIDLCSNVKACFSAFFQGKEKNKQNQSQQLFVLDKSHTWDYGEIMNLRQGLHVKVKFC